MFEFENLVTKDIYEYQFIINFQQILKIYYKLIFINVFRDQIFKFELLIPCLNYY